ALGARYSLPTRRSSDLLGGVVRQRAVEEAEALVVLRGQHRVAHPGLAGGARDLAGVEAVGVEQFGVPLVVLGAVLLPRHHPFMRSEEHTSELQSRFDLV